VSKSRAKSKVAPVLELEHRGTHVQEHRLANGLTVLLAERHMDPVVAVMTWYKVGARNETEREAGVSHFLEHMMFKGSAHFGKGQVDLITTTLGGSNNAFTTADHTAYWFELASDRWEKALEIEADRMRSLALEAREFEAEKSVVLEELSMGEDDPWRNLTQEVQNHVFPRHPYRRPVIGYTDTLKALQVEEMRAYYRRFYHPGNAVLVICGDIDAQAALALARRHFEPIPAGPERATVDVLRPQNPEPKGEQRLKVTWDDPASRLCIAWPSAAVGTQDDHVLDVVSTLLTGGRLSRLYRSLVLGDALATSISTHNDARLRERLVLAVRRAGAGQARRGPRAGHRSRARAPGRARACPRRSSRAPRRPSSRARPTTARRSRTWPRRSASTASTCTGPRPSRSRSHPRGERQGRAAVRAAAAHPPAARAGLERAASGTRSTRATTRITARARRRALKPSTPSRRAAGPSRARAGDRALPARLRRDAARLAPAGRTGHGGARAHPRRSGARSARPGGHGLPLRDAGRPGTRDTARARSPSCSSRPAARSAATRPACTGRSWAGSGSSCSS
jgi:predicted Zn-dependent peptidase